MYRVFGLILLMLFQQLSAQDVIPDRQVWDFGDVRFWKNDTARFKVRNATEHDMVFLPTYYREDIGVFFSSRLVEPGQSAEISMVYYTTLRGKFQLDIPLYVSVRSEPLIFKLKGNVKGFHPDAQLRCPVVNPGSPSENQQEKLVTIEIRDRNTDLIIKPDEFWVNEASNKKVRVEPHAQGFRMAVIPGAFRVSSTKKGYEDYLALISLEPYQQKFIVYMDPKPEDEPIIAEQTQNTGSSRDGPQDELITDTVPEQEHIHPNDPLLDTRLYKWNNLVFVVDASMSMKRDTKLEKLMSIMDVLVDALRAEDRLGVISFSNSASVVQAHGPVSGKDSIKARIHRLKADGGTNGGAAFKLAYELAKQHYEPDGNNQIVIVTDGIFTTGSMNRKTMEAMIVDGNKAGIHLSAISLGGDAKAVAFLNRLSTLGGGDNIHILPSENNYEAALNMVKTQSHR